VLFLLLILPGRAVAEEKWYRIETVLHIHSRYSYRGKLTPEQIVKNAKEKGIRAIIFTDEALAKISYGLFPFRRVLSISVQKDSVFKKGLHRYLKEIEELNRKYPDLLVMAAVEVAPFYYWERSPLTSHGVVRDWSKHLLVMGLDEKGYRSLPLVGNGLLPLSPFRIKDLFRLWGALVALSGIFCLRKRAFDYRDEKGRTLGPPSPFFQRLGWMLMVVGALSLVENYPYRESATSIYGAEGKILPYQRLIDDVRKKGGLVFWAHPEAKTIPHVFGPENFPVTFLTNPYPEALLETKNYMGFAIFFEGFKTIGPPGGIWDQLLLAFCRGERPNPIWAIGELDYTEEGRSATWIDTVKTILFVKEKSKAALLETLREGRMVAVRRSREGEIIFGHFWVEDTKTGRRARLGETLLVEGSPRVNFSLSFKGSVPPSQIRLIRNGEIIQEWKETLPVGKAYEDSSAKEGVSYYRLEVQSGNGDLVATNPIFVSRKEIKG